jgi:hypothetical protein
MNALGDSIQSILVPVPGEMYRYLYFLVHKNQPIQTSTKTPGWERVKNMPGKGSTRKVNWYYELAEFLVVMLPVVIFVYLFKNGTITLGPITAENINQEISKVGPYLLMGAAVYLIVLAVILGFLRTIIFGKKGSLPKTESSQGSQPVNLAGQPVPPESLSADAAAQPIKTGTQTAAPAAQSTVPTVQATDSTAQPASGKPFPKKLGTCLIIMVVVVAIVFTLFQVGKSVLPKLGINFNGLPWGSGPEAYQLWKGEMPSTFYSSDIFGVAGALKNTGKPFMIIKYNNITQEILDLEFGISEYSFVNLTDVPAIPFACLVDLNDQMYHQELSLKPLVTVLVNWNTPSGPWGEGSTKTIVQGVQQISFDYGGNHWIFNYTNIGMIGGVTTFDSEMGSGMVSEENAFTLRRIN